MNLGIPLLFYNIIVGQSVLVETMMILYNTPALDPLLRSFLINSINIFLRLLGNIYEKLRLLYVECDSEECTTAGCIFPNPTSCVSSHKYSTNPSDKQDAEAKKSLVEQRSVQQHKNKAINIGTSHKDIEREKEPKQDRSIPNHVQQQFQSKHVSGKPRRIVV